MIIIPFLMNKQAVGSVVGSADASFDNVSILGRFGLLP